MGLKTLFWTPKRNKKAPQGHPKKEVTLGNNYDDLHAVVWGNETKILFSVVLEMNTWDGKFYRP